MLCVTSASRQETAGELECDLRGTIDKGILLDDDVILTMGAVPFGSSLEYLERLLVLVTVPHTQLFPGLRKNPYDGRYKCMKH